MRNKFFSKRPGLVQPGTTESKEEEEKKKEEFVEDHESSPSALVITTVDDEDFLQNLDNDEDRLDRLQTTLQVSTVYPEDHTEEFFEVMTIRSPYTFNIEDDQKSTRFITVTRTSTRTAEIEPTSSFSLVLGSTSIFPTPSSHLDHTPLFDTASIPAPENILAPTSTPDLVLRTSIDIVTLPPLILASSLHHATPPLKTVTEKFSTEEEFIKKSILPVVMGDDTKYLTLSQTYSITRFITATKTIPPMELYSFSPEHSFTDFDNLFEEAGSENREALLPGELEFSDQDNFGLEGPVEHKLIPPRGFLEDQDLLGEKQDLIHMMEKHNNPNLFTRKNPPSLEGSFQTPSAHAPNEVRIGS